MGNARLATKGPACPEFGMFIGSELSSAQRPWLLRPYPDQLHENEPIGTGIEEANAGCHMMYMWAEKI